MTTRHIAPLVRADNPQPEVRWESAARPSCETAASPPTSKRSRNSSLSASSATTSAAHGARPVKPKATEATPTVLQRVGRLLTMDLEELREEWRTLFGGEVPGYGRDLLRRRLAYRVQELAYGGLAEATRQRLRDIDERAQQMKAREAGRPVAGTVLIKEYRGERHEVTVRADGFDYRGQRYESLSVIARRITGTNWNGPRFFGLRSSSGKDA